jgi:predicted nucleic acid-binding protein
MIIVDTNILIDVIEDDPFWADWSDYQLTLLGQVHELAINPVIYAELSASFKSTESLHREIAGLELEFHNFPHLALFKAGMAFGEYRRRGGPRKTLLPDFFIGAHAAAMSCPILTRDPDRFRSYFPSVELITPETDRGFCVHEPTAAYLAA